MNGADEHQFAEARALEPLIDGQPPDAHCRKRGIPRQSFGFLRREIDQGNAGFDKEEAIGDPAPNVLGRLSLEIPV
jgi:hypothetical protein